MIELVRRLKDQYGLKAIAVSNEGRELTTYRVQQFELTSVIDFLFRRVLSTTASLMQTCIRLLGYCSSGPTASSLY